MILNDALGLQPYHTPWEAFSKSKALCPALWVSLLCHFHPHIYKSHIILVAVVMIKQISFHFIDMHYHLIHFHHLSVSHEQVSTLQTLHEPFGIRWVIQHVHDQGFGHILGIQQSMGDSGGTLFINKLLLRSCVGH